MVFFYSTDKKKALLKEKSCFGFLKIIFRKFTCRKKNLLHSLMALKFLPYIMIILKL